MLRDSLIAAVRTGVAALVGLLVTWLVTKGIEVGQDTEANLSVALFGLFTAAYNALVILLERKVHPLFGVLLGVPKAPAYGTVGTTTPGGATPETVQQALDYVSPEKPNVTAPPPAPIPGV